MVGLAASALLKNLEQAIAQYGERVEVAIAYLQHQQQKRKIENPVGYLYEAIVSGWALSVSQTTPILPEGFNEWSDQVRAQGLVIASMMIDGIHHVLHAKNRWLPTIQMMQEKFER